jgi:hypothetical protein
MTSKIVKVFCAILNQGIPNSRYLDKDSRRRKRCSPKCSNAELKEHALRGYPTIARPRGLVPHGWREHLRGLYQVTMFCESSSLLSSVNRLSVTSRDPSTKKDYGEREKLLTGIGRFMEEASR